MLRIVKGDLLLAKEAVICHQVNCQDMMGSGVAKALYTKWPEIKREYHAFCADKRPRELLGKIQVVELAEFPAMQKVVINIFGQLKKQIYATAFHIIAIKGFLGIFPTDM